MKYNNIKRRIQAKMLDALHPWSCVYGEYYNPIYNNNAKFDFVEPEYYSREGNRLEPFFLRDFHTAHEPYFFDSKYFFMDRYNFGLNTHFYTHNCMLEQMGHPTRRYGVLYESCSIVPDDYRIFENNKGLEKDFDAVFTFSQDILERIPNAKFVPFQARPWYGTEKWGGAIDGTRCYRKTKTVSFLASNKIMCDMHRFRFDLAMKCKSGHLADTFGTFDGGPYASLSETLDDYMYSIIIENEMDDLYFSERLTNCFLSMTVPIYFGARKIGDWFNAGGIISASVCDIDRTARILSSCTEEDYKNRIPAIKDNFERVKKFRNVFDWMYEEYLK